MQKIIIFFFIIVFSYTVFSAVKTATTFEPDFSIFYKSAQDIRIHISPYQDKSLYTAFNYPLISAALFIPFTLLTFIYSQMLFTFISLCSVMYAVYATLKLNKKNLSLSLFLFVTSLTLLSFPVKFTLGMGQVNLLAYAFLLGGFLAFQQKKNVIKQMLFLILAVLLKPLLVFVLLVFLFEKKWKVFFMIIGCVVLFAFLTIYIVGQPQANASFLHMMFSQTMIGREVYYNQGFLGFISRIISNLELRFVINIIGVVFFCVITLLKVKNKGYVGKISLLLTTLLLIDPLSWQHHFIFLLLPFFFVWTSIQKYAKNRTVYYLLFVFAYILAAWNFKNPQQLMTLPLSLLLSNQFYATCILFGLQLKLV